MQEKSQLRYARQIRLKQIGKSGQQRLLDAHALIVGMGGLGSPAALYLAAAGVGTLTICDFDQVELSNLQRQIIHTNADIGRLKTESAADALKAINPDIKIHTMSYYPEEGDLQDVAKISDIILDCTDNFESRFALNRISKQTKKPLVSGAAIRWEGQITVFDPTNSRSPCYQCLYPNASAPGATCESEGVVAPVVGVIGTMQAQAAINILLGLDSLIGSVLLYDAHAMTWQQITLEPNPNCSLCQPKN